ncbi:hypothetical protein BH11MYX1_BH11MYX1_17220 [soil metagenome]
MRITWLAVVVACAPNLAELDRDNAAAVARSQRNLAAAGTPFTPVSVSIADLAEADAPRSHDALPAHVSQPADPKALLGTEHVGALDDGRLVFAGAYCVQTAKCSNDCREYASYTFATAADGHVIVTRTHPRYVAVASHDDSSCSGSCGGTQQAHRDQGDDPATLAAVLGKLTPDQVEIRDNSYTVKYVEQVCTNMTPVP